jgi:hypothetical protein
MDRVRRTVGLAFGAVAALLVAAASASTAPPLPFDVLIRESAVAALGTPVRQVAVWEDDRIFTYSDVHIDTRVAGSAGSADDVWVRTMGGEIGRVGQATEGEAVLTIGQSSLLFLRPATTISRHDGKQGVMPAPNTYVVVGRAQGQFPVGPDNAGAMRLLQNRAIGALLRPAGSPITPLASEVLVGKSLSDAAPLVQGAWSHSHAP